MTTDNQTPAAAHENRLNEGAARDHDNEHLAGRSERGTKHRARRSGRRRKLHARRAGRTGTGTRNRGHRRPDWDDLGDLERYQRDLEQRAADVAARIDDVSERIKELRSGSEPVGDRDL